MLGFVLTHLSGVWISIDMPIIGIGIDIHTVWIGLLGWPLFVWLTLPRIGLRVIVVGAGKR